MARSERFELPTLGIEIRCSIQLSYERVRGLDYQTCPGRTSSPPLDPARSLGDTGAAAFPACRGPARQLDPAPIPRIRGKLACRCPFLAPTGCLTKSQHTNARVLA